MGYWEKVFRRIFRGSELIIVVIQGKFIFLIVQSPCLKWNKNG